MPDIYAPEVVEATRRRKLVIWTAGIVALLAIGGALFLKFYRNKPRVLPPTTMEGSVLKNAAETEKQQPISDVVVTAVSGTSMGEAKTNEVGFFSLVMRPGVKRGAPVAFNFQHPDYKPLDVEEIADGKIIISRLTPLKEIAREVPKGPQIEVSNIVVRYSVRTTTTANTGSAVKTFQAVNTANIPCRGNITCSPDGKWKAAIGSISLDAGAGNVFQNARVSCISGPCAFTRIESNEPSEGGRKMTVSALNWSDTATFLVEAEVVHPMVGDVTLESYPVIFGEALNFNLPPTAEGLSIGAALNKESILFPIGPALCLSWADCKVSVAKDQTKSYRCELKPGYKFPSAP